MPQLRIPTHLSFHEDAHSRDITWDGRVLVMPDVLLHPENERLLRPELARQLMYYNGPDLRVLHILNCYPQSLGGGILLLALGNFLVFPALVREIAGTRWRGERVLDADRFAFLLGEGIALRSILTEQREEQRQQGVLDTAFPTFSERIDQLDALIQEEQQQIQHRGIPLQRQIQRV